VIKNYTYPEQTPSWPQSAHRHRGLPLLETEGRSPTQCGQQRLVSDWPPSNPKRSQQVPTAEIRAAIAELEAGKGERFESVAALMADLNAGD